MQNTCPGLVQQIEAGDLDGVMTRKILADALLPMIEEGIDNIVLGCTHYPFVIPQIRSIAGPDVGILDPAPAVARQVQRILEAKNLLSEIDCETCAEYLTSGNPLRFAEQIHTLIGSRTEVRKVVWQDGVLLDPVDG